MFQHGCNRIATSGRRSYRSAPVNATVHTCCLHLPTCRLQTIQMHRQSQLSIVCVQLVMLMTGLCAATETSRQQALAHTAGFRRAEAEILHAQGSYTHAMQCLLDQDPTAVSTLAYIRSALGEPALNAAQLARLREAVFACVPELAQVCVTEMNRGLQLQTQEYAAACTRMYFIQSYAARLAACMPAACMLTCMAAPESVQRAVDMPVVHTICSITRHSDCMPLRCRPMRMGWQGWSWRALHSSSCNSCSR